mmetsp:Transcript_22219/g.52491  ORF Transcript_22219/g.52491 Transcript_22219/m.52491 type:complete len:88 (+) Transcript_22219:98-361(+)
MYSRLNGWRRRRPSRDYDYDDTPNEEAHREHGEKKTYEHGRAKNVLHTYRRRIIQVGVRPGLRKSLSFGQLELLELTYGCFALDTSK